MSIAANTLDWKIREFDAACDADAVCKLDASFTSNLLYEVRAEAEAIHIEMKQVHPPHKKRFQIELKADPWQQGYVATVNGVICGFIAMGFSAWNRRMSIWHFYVDPSYRGRGGGRQLMRAGLEWGRKVGAATAWVETTNFNVPGIKAYRHLGFDICGYDATLYRGTSSEGEVAIFMARQIGENVP